MPRDLKTLAILPSAGDDATDAVKLALAVRNAASVTGRCACGAVASNPVEVSPGVFSVRFEHEHDCPATALDVATELPAEGRSYERAS